jgi:hypothetical protein
MVVPRCRVVIEDKAMSKRRSKSSPNLPPEVIERARRQLAEQSGAGDAGTAAPKADSPAEAPAAAPKAAPRAAVAVPRAAVPAASTPRIRRTTPRSAPSTARTGGRQPDQLDSAYLRERLANPTRMVTEEELHAEYGYVIKDLRSMGLLSIGLIVALVILGNIIQ